MLRISKLAKAKIAIMLFNILNNINAMENKHLKQNTNHEDFSYQNDRVLSDFIMNIEGSEYMKFIYDNNDVCACTKIENLNEIESEVNLNELESEVNSNEIESEVNSNEIENEGISNEIENEGNSNEIESEGNSNEIESEGNSNEIESEGNLELDYIFSDILKYVDTVSGGLQICKDNEDNNEKICKEHYKKIIKINSITKYHKRKIKVMYENINVNIINTTKI